MSRPYSPYAVPRELLRAYCVAHRVPLDERVFASDTVPPQAVALTRGLSLAIRPRFDGDLREVHDLATDDGTQALLAEVRDGGLDLPSEYHALAGLLDRSEASLERDRTAGRLPAPVWLGGSRKWRRTEIERWVEAGCPSQSEWEELHRE